MGEFGIAFLLFVLGLELKLRHLRLIGKSALIVGVIQIALVFGLGYKSSLLFGFSVLESLYIGLALTFSSTIIVVKLLSDKKDLHSLYGKITIGILLLQDLLAILALIFLSSFTSGFNLEALTLNGSFLLFLILAAKIIFVFGLVFYLSGRLFPKLVHLAAGSGELLFLLSIAWVFGMAAIVSSPPIGFSIEIGGLLAGIALANSMENFAIMAKIRVLRDFFITLFFVFLGIQMDFSNVDKLILPAFLLSILVLAGKPLIIMGVMGFLGFRKRNSFLTGITLAQISEFSLIIVFLGQSLGQISNRVVSLITMVAILTFILSTYLIVSGNRIYINIVNYLKFFERKKVKSQDFFGFADGFEDLKNHVVLVGGDQMGRSILDALGDQKKAVVVDFDPAIVEKIQKNNTLCLFGDIGDIDIQQKAKLDDARLVISTIPDIEDNLLLLKELNSKNRKAKVVIMALDSFDAKTLYKAGADYVVLPHLAGGRQIAKILAEGNLDKIEELKSKDWEYLK